VLEKGYECREEVGATLEGKKKEAPKGTPICKDKPTGASERSQWLVC